MTRRFLLAVAAFLFVLAVAPTHAGAGQERIEIDQVDTSNYPLVTVTVTAPSSLLGVTVPTTDWRLLEAGSGRAITTEPLNTEALSLVLVMDTSGSMAGEPLIDAKAAALAFVDRLPQGTHVSVVGFDATADVATGFTTDRDEISVAVDSLSARAPGTALYDGVARGIEQIRRAPGRRTAMVVLSDGGDSDSTTDIGEVTVDLANTDTNFSIVELVTPDSDRDALEELADAGAGQIVGADDPDALAGVYTSIADQLANQYRINYTSVTNEVDTRIELVIDSAGVEAYGSTDVALPPLDERSDEPVVDDIAAPEAPRSRVEDGPGLLGSSWAIWVGVLACTVALGVFGAFAFAPRATRRSLSSDAESPRGGHDGYGEILTGIGERASDFSSHVLERSGALPSLDEAIDEAGLELRPGELAAITVGTALFGGLFFGLALSAFIGLIVFALPFLIAPAALSILRSRRQQAFADQLADTLLLFASTLRAGYGVGQAIDTVARETPEPTASEFGRVVLETRLGRSVEEALATVARRMKSEDFEWVVDAVQIQRDVGGDLAEILDHVADTIRARTRIRRQVAALTAEGRISAIVLMVLPFGIGLLVHTSNPDYLDPLFDETAGRIMLGAGALLLLAGALWLKKLVEPEF